MTKYKNNKLQFFVLAIILLSCNTFTLGSRTFYFQNRTGYDMLFEIYSKSKRNLTFEVKNGYEYSIIKKIEKGGNTSPFPYETDSIVIIYGNIKQKIVYCDGKLIQGCFKDGVYLENEYLKLNGPFRKTKRTLWQSSETLVFDEEDFKKASPIIKPN
jgi:hypothetical protein